VPTAYLAPSLLKELTDVSVVSPGAGQSGRPLFWNNATGKFELAQSGIPIVFPASTSAGGSIKLASGADPSAPTVGEIWFTGSAVKIRINGETKTFAFVGDVIIDTTNLSFDLSSNFSTLTTRYF